MAQLDRAFSAKEVAWVVAVVGAGPLLLVTLLGLNELAIGIHYGLYLLGLALACIYFVASGLGRDTSALVRVMAPTLGLTVVWDLGAPLTTIPTFAVLKILFYLLVLILLTSLLFDSRSLLDPPDARPHPISLLLISVALLFINNAFVDRYYLSDLEGGPFVQGLSSPIIQLSILAMFMVGGAALVAVRPGQVTRRRTLLVPTATILAATVAVVSFARIFPTFAQIIASSQSASVCMRRADSALTDTSRMIILYLFIFMLLIFNDRYRFYQIVQIIFSASILLVYLALSHCSAYEAVLRLIELSARYSPWSGAILLVLAILADLIALLEFRKRRTRRDTVPTAPED